MDWIRATNSAGVAYGEGPIHNATRWTSTEKLDRAGDCSFEVPAADPRAWLLQSKREAHYYRLIASTVTEIGALIIDKLELVVQGRSQPMLRVSGGNLLHELTYRSVGYLELYDVETVTATSVAHTWRYGDQTTYYSDDLTTAYDGDPGTVYQIDIGLKSWNYLYVCAATPISAVTIDFTNANTGDASTLSAQYWDGSAWQTLTISNDGTHDGTRTLAQDGKITFTRPSDQDKITHNGVDGYWCRMWPSADTSLAIYIAEVDVDQDTETLTGVADIMAYAPAGWSVDDSGEGYSGTQNGAYMQFAGESVLEALQMLAEHTGEHFRLGTGKTIEWLQDDPNANPTASDVLIASGGDTVAPQTNAYVALIQTLSEITDSYEQISRVYPYGSGTGSGRVTLAAASDSAPGGYTLSKANNYLKHDATEAALGQIELYRQWPEVGLQDDSTVHGELASNQLLQTAYEYLRRHIEPQYSYRIRVIGLRQTLKPGQTARVICQHHRDGERYIDIDGNLIVLAATREVDGRGVYTAEVEAATVDAWPMPGGQFLVRELRNARRARAGDGNVGMIAAGATSLTDLELNSVLLLKQGNAYPGVYTPDDSGLTSAITAASAGDAILLPSGGFAANHTIPADVELIGRGLNTVITGQVTGNDGAALRSVYVDRSVDSADPAYGVVGGGTEVFRVIDCWVRVVNASGPARGVGVTAGGQVRCLGVRVSTQGTEGYGFYAANGYLYLNDTVARAADQTTGPIFIGG